VQIAKGGRRARVIGTVSSDSKTALVKQYGADEGDKLRKLRLRRRDDAPDGRDAAPT